MKYLIFSSLAVFFVLSLFWLGGFDFNERGDTAVFCSLFCTTAVFGTCLTIYGKTHWT